MSAALRKESFNADFDAQYRWYLGQGGEELASRFQHAVVVTLRSLARQPDIGRPLKFRNPVLRGLRSIKVKPPFGRILIFYRFNDEGLTAWRLMDGARDLPRRLAESPALD